MSKTNQAERTLSKNLKKHDKRISNIQFWGGNFILQAGNIGYFTKATKFILRFSLNNLKKHTEVIPQLDPFGSEGEKAKVFKKLKVERDKLHKKMITSIEQLQKCLSSKNMKVSDFNSGIKQLKSGLDLLSKYRANVGKIYDKEFDRSNEKVQLDGSSEVL